MNTSPMSAKTLAAGITSVLLLTLSPTMVNATTGPRVERSVEGVWSFTLTPRNCITGIPIPGAAFQGLFTFHKGGTMSAWVQNAVITVTRSASHGLWQRDHGWRDYSFKFVHLRYDPSGYFAGQQVATGTLALSESGNQFTADSVNTVFDAEGNPQASGCGNAVGTRVEMDP
jgi:hypothetical protein